MAEVSFTHDAEDRDEAMQVLESSELPLPVRAMLMHGVLLGDDRPMKLSAEGEVGEDGSLHVTVSVG